MKNTERPQRPRKADKGNSFSPKTDKRSDKKNFSDEKRSYSDKKSSSGFKPKSNFPKKDGYERSFTEPRFGEKRPFGEKKPFVTESSDRPFDKKRSFGEKKTFSDARSSSRREEGTDKKRPYGERKTFGDRPARGSEEGFDKKRPYGERKTFGDRPARRSEEGFDKKRPYGERKTFGDRPARGSEEGFDKKRPYGERKTFGDRPAPRSEEGFDKKRPYGERKTFGDRPARGSEEGFDKKRPYGERKTFGDRPAPREDEGFTEKRTFSRDKGRPERRDNNRDRGFGRDARTERKENQASASKIASPDYNLDKMKNSLPPKVQRKIESVNKESDGLIRLNRYISNAGIASRRDADELIASGQITVNGKEITEMGYKVKPGDVVKYGKKILNPEKLVYILLNKPKDFITTTEDPNERRTVMDLVANACDERVYPVGRLDRNTTGLLLLTNDGELAEKLSHPSNEIRKIYQVELDKPIASEHFEAIREGIELEDGFIKADDLALVTPDAEVVGIEIHSGKNRIVRRIFEHFGYEVLKLDRTTYAGLNKKDLPRGKWRFLTEKEVIRLKYMI
ncbi:pseudouridine synthase [Emticicia sp. 17c]|uniref:pseudouridine synthase n=1 Tax=Emticicia sp. 17c TaxID=3127704 RepID=UPI00301D4AD9